MASNYDAITADNVRRRGEEFDDIGEFLSQQFYSDQTHFIYELLQNAQDALKRRAQNEPDSNFPRTVTFNLFSDRLELRHYGQPFNYNDVCGISDILRGTKADDIKQIGRFGIGFKSVYAFTSSPEIYSGDEHFVIERYIRPKNVSPRVLNPGETLFIFPFNHPNKSIDQTYKKIRDRLADLKLRTILFLDEIEQIDWSQNGVRAGAYIRSKEKLSENIWQVTLLGEEKKKTVEEQWLVFQRLVTIAKVSSDTSVEIAFKLANDKKSEKTYIEPLDRSNLVAYFETDRETGLHFLIQGHYQTTPSRDNVLIDNPINKQLIQETAKLLVETLEYLKTLGYLNAATLQVMPLERNLFSDDTFFKPIYDRFENALKTQRFLPSIDGRYISAKEAKLARGTDLLHLIPSDKLKDFFGFSQDYSWLSDEITRDKTPELREFVMNVLKVDEIDPERFARQLTTDFLEKQSDQWFIEFYQFLNGQRALWRPKSSYEREGILRSKTIIRTDGGDLVSPFDQAGNPVVFLPGDSETEFPTVKRSLIRNKGAMQFLNNLGLGEPDAVDEVIKYILPKYKGDSETSITDKEHLLHIKKIAHALDIATGSKRDRLIPQLKNTPFLRAVNPGSAKRGFKKPHEIYLDDDALRDYFDGNPNVWFYDPIYIRQKRLLEDLGVSRKVKMLNHTEKFAYKTLQDYFGWHVRGLEGFDPDWEVEGLLFAVQHPSINRAKFIWNHILRPNKHLIIGIVEKSKRQDYSSSEKETQVSKAGEIVRTGRWLPDNGGNYCIPAELSLDDLPEDFVIDEELAEKLGMKGLTIKAFASERGIDENALSLALEVIRKDPEGFKVFANQTLEKPNTNYVESNFNFLDSLRETFEKSKNDTPENEIDDFHFNSEPNSNGTVPDPERRRKKVREEIYLAMLSEMENSQRFKRIPSIVWEKKDNRIRAFLLEEYHGCCQICGSVFNKRDGVPYFEGLYLVSRTSASWVERPGNVLCLCANCCARFQYGEVITEDIINQILQCKMKKEGGSGYPSIVIELCGEIAEIRFTERHLLDLQEMVKSSSEGG